MLLNNQWISEEIEEEIKKYLETNANENMMIQNLSAKREVCSNIISPSRNKKSQ